MTDHIKTQFANLERQHSIKIRYAVESGSRARGFASADSDWDVRFIYLHRERTNTMAPTEFQKLFEAEVKDGYLKLEIEKLLARKMGGEELSEEPKIEVLNAFLEEKIEYYTEYLKDYNFTNQPDTEELNRIFRTSLARLQQEKGEITVETDWSAPMELVYSKDLEALEAKAGVKIKR